MKYAKKAFSVLLSALFLSTLALPVLAQSELTLAVHRDFGSAQGSQIRGTFSMDVQSASPLQSVTFKIDQQVIQEVKAAPFKIQFNTATYANGWHELSATAITTSGQTLQSNTKRFQFMSAEEASKAMTSILVPLFGAVGVLILATVGVQFLMFRSRSQNKVPLGAPRTYGFRGGTICPRCHRPFPIHWWAMNLTFAGKLDTCEHCGRFGFFRPYPMQKLREAEAAEVQDAVSTVTPIHELSEEEKLRQQLESSKYEDL